MTDTQIIALALIAAALLPFVVWLAIDLAVQGLCRLDRRQS